MTDLFPNPEIVEKPERFVAALSKQFTMDTRHEIPALWGQLWEHDFELEGLNKQEAIGVSYGVTPGNPNFNYAAGYETASPDAEPVGGCIVTLSAGRYVRFAKSIPYAEIPQHFDWVFSQWLPNSGHQQREGAVFEVYPDDPDANEIGRLMEIWVPIT